MRLLPKEKTLACLQPPLPPGQRLPGGVFHLPLLRQPHQVRRAHEEDLASVAFTVPIRSLLESKEDLSVDDLRLVAAERPDCATSPGVCAVNLSPRNQDFEANIQTIVFLGQLK